MNSEITQLPDTHWLKGWVLYDGDCALCRRWVDRFEAILTRRGFDLAPLQAPWVRECLDLPEADLFAAMRVLTPDGRDFVGADALIFLARHIWWAWPIYALAQFPGARPLLRRAYQLLARHRSCAGGACQYDTPTQKTSDSDQSVV